jgi:hypothetical protein
MEPSSGVASSFLLGMCHMFNFNLQDGEGKYRTIGGVMGMSMLVSGNIGNMG